MLFLVHHGEAVAADEDSRRPLTSAGRAQCERLARDAAALGACPEKVRHSGKLRARETAQIFAAACNPSAPVRAERGLQPDDPPEWARDALRAEEVPVMIVGHMPHVARLLRLLTRDEGAAFPIHGIVALDRTSDAWEERWRLEG